MEYILSPSILSADFKALGEQMKATEENGARYLHFDVMDGMFVPNISLGIPVLAGLAKEVRAFYDVHLMIERPLDYVPQFVKAGANAVTFHLEAKSDVRQTLRAIRAQGVLAGLSIKPAASPEAVLAVFALPSRAGDYGAWDRNTRVVIVGEAGGFGDSLAQQVLTCALYGSVRYDDLDAALSALERGTADAVLGMIAPQDGGVSRALGRVRNLELLSMPESLIAVRVPDEAVREHALELGGQTAQTYALFGALCTGGAVSTEQEEAAYRAAQEAGILSVGAPGAILE